jgi:hypothetical protein
MQGGECDGSSPLVDHVIRLLDIRASTPVARPPRTYYLPYRTTCNAMVPRPVRRSWQPPHTRVRRRRWNWTRVQRATLIDFLLNVGWIPWGDSHPRGHTIKLSIHVISETDIYIYATMSSNSWTGQPAPRRFVSVGLYPRDALGILGNRIPAFEVIGTSPVRFTPRSYTPPFPLPSWTIPGTN